MFLFLKNPILAQALSTISLVIPFKTIINILNVFNNYPPPSKQNEPTPSIIYLKKATSTIYRTHWNKRSNTTPEDDQQNESAWANIGFFLYQLDPNVRRLVRRLERLHLKILKKKESTVFN